MSRIDGFTSINKPSLSGEAKINASLVRTKRLEVTGNATFSNITSSGTISSPTGIFVYLDSANATFDSVYVSTGLTGSNLHATNIYSSNLIQGPTGIIDNIKSTNVNFTNIISGPTGIFSNVFSTSGVTIAGGSNPWATTGTLLNISRASRSTDPIMVIASPQNTTQGDRSSIYLGVNNSNRNFGQIYFDYQGNSSLSNSMYFGMYNGITLKQNGDYCGISQTNPTVALDVGGAIKGSSSLTISANTAIDTNTLFVDTVNDRIGVGTSTPSSTLDIVKGEQPTVQIGANTAQRISIFQSGTSNYIDFTGDGKLNVRNGSETSRVLTVDFSDVTSFLRCSTSNLGIETGGGTLYSNSVFNSTTAGTADMTISGVNGFIQRVSSSMKYKTNIEPIDDVYSENIYKLRPVWYRSTCATDRKDYSHYGLLAEETSLIDPRLATYDHNGDPSGIQWYKVIPLIIQEMKKLKKRIDELEEKNV